ncbi:hypothetical protein N7462_009853 [Penicillium macrosclerotiorum]|uniref:uncharacterized protein n=1 Tax=Penicillium macrosclerotiorum TaxID=303699 RepID=UPI00254743B2|nr:uncharacterized protein N7462_009853 [Penicillium macrosclerotiorum]KAJ5668783.1 hypothetical protein N7462_009853 [Penicillium macrosclerotiorum]
MNTEVENPPEALFRPSKRRKFIRRRADGSDETAVNGEEPTEPTSAQNRRTPESHATAEKDESTQESIVVRQRRLPHTRKGGIGFSATSRLGQDNSRQTALSSVEDTGKEEIQAMGDRFTAYTGQTVDVDRHMMAYIDSEMAKRHQRGPLPETPEASQSPSPSAIDGRSIPGQQERKPATLGRLHEIDLGEETKLENIARTQAAARRLEGHEELPLTGESSIQSDGAGTGEKRWRNRKRRTSADIERDRLVEEVLREMDVYDEPEDEPQADDQAADDRVAEQFRRDFLDAIQSRRRTRTTKTVNKTEAPRGPKLGGSRSARAAMREMQGKSGQK